MYAIRSYYARFKSKHSGWQAFQCPQHVKVDFENSRITLPKIPSIRAFLHRKFDGLIKTVTIKRSPSGHYTASVLVEDGQNLPDRFAVEQEKTRNNFV